MHTGCRAKAGFKQNKRNTGYRLRRVASKALILSDWFSLQIVGMFDHGGVVVKVDRCLTEC